MLVGIHLDATHALLPLLPLIVPCFGLLAWIMHRYILDNIVSVSCFFSAEKVLGTCSQVFWMLVGLHLDATHALLPLLTFNILLSFNLGCLFVLQTATRRARGKEPVRTSNPLQGMGSMQLGPLVQPPR